MMQTSDIRKLFVEKYKNKDICENGTIEILNASFLANEDEIFGKLKHEYIKKELKWYMSCELNINNMDKPVPKIWQEISGDDGYVNSNYGWCIFSQENNNQYLNALLALKFDKNSRQAAMIYNRPLMHNDAKKNNCSDFMCTYSTQAIIRNNKLHYFVYMRSNDAVFGYKNDLAWHKFVHSKLFNDLRDCYSDIEIGDIYWNAASLHIYESHFGLIK